jgi:hypothetical protein
MANERNAYVTEESKWITWRSNSLPSEPIPKSPPKPRPTVARVTGQLRDVIIGAAKNSAQSVMDRGPCGLIMTWG